MDGVRTLSAALCCMAALTWCGCEDGGGGGIDPNAQVGWTQLREALDPVIASGRGVSNAGAYQPDVAGVHKVFLMDASYAAWEPHTLAETELVEVRNLSFQRTGMTKTYSDGKSYELQTAHFEMTLREARTGKVVAQAAFDATDWPNFARVTPGTTWVTADLDPKPVINWLRPYVER